MSKEHFIQLVEGFCALSNLDKPELLVRGEPVMVNDVAFSLIHSEQIDPALLFIYADFGKLPSRREAEACMALMEANLFLYTGKGPAFAISPETKNVTLADNRMLGKITPEELRDIMVNVSAKAKEWRSTHFLDMKLDAPRVQRGAFQSLHLKVKK